MHKKTIVQDSYRSQSTATMRLMSSVGSPTAVKTRIIVTRPALGMLAAPILARVAVKLRIKQNKIKNLKKNCFFLLIHLETLRSLFCYFIELSLNFWNKHNSHSLLCIPDRYHLSCTERNAIHLSNEYGCHSFVQGSSIHIDSCSNWENKPGDPSINSEVVFQTLECYWQGGRAVRNI